MRKLKNQAEFWRALGRLPNRWRMRLGVVRCEKGDCPIVALARARGVEAYNSAAEVAMNEIMRVKSDRFAFDIIHAADNIMVAPQYRARLLRTIGLKETVSK